MSENLELERQLKLVAKTGSYVVGRREVASSLKGSKLLVWSASANVPQSILDESRSLSIPAIKFSGNPVELGRACGIPFRVSVIALKSAGDADLSAFTKATDYHSGVVVQLTKQQQASQETKSRKESQPVQKSKKEPAAVKKTKEGSKGESTGTKKTKKAEGAEEGKKSKSKPAAEKESSSSSSKKDADDTKQKKAASPSSSKKKSSSSSSKSKSADEEDADQ